ncbi:MAG: hypothetical protein H7832_01230 [Magnetococcus sp. DMHC-6]
MKTLSEGATVTPQKKLEKITQSLLDLSLFSREGFHKISEYMNYCSNNYAITATRSISIKERINATSGGKGMTPLKTDLRKAFQEINAIFKILEELIVQKEAFKSNLTEVIDWTLDTEKEAFLPAILDHYSSRGVDNFETKTMGAMIDNLIGQIRPLSREVFSSCQEATDVMNLVSRRLRSDLQASQYALKILKAATTEGTQKLSLELDQAKNLCDQMAERSNQVNGVVFEMIQSIQYDDITSQRLEHVIEALNRVREKLQATPLTENSIRWIVICLRIIIPQIDELGTDLVNAVQSVQNLLGRINGICNEQIVTIEETRQIGMIFHQNTSDVTYSVGELLRLEIFADTLTSDVMRAFSQTENAIFQAKRALDMLSMTSERLDGLIGSLKQRHADRPSLLLDHIAHLIQRIRHEEQGKNVLLTEATDLLYDANQTFSEKITPRIMRTNSMMRRMPLTTRQLDSNNNDLMGVVSENMSNIKATANQTAYLTEEITFHLTIKKKLERLSEGLNEILREIGGDISDRIDDAHLSEMAQEFDDLKSLYTMESERRIHAGVLESENSGDNSENEDNFELF